MSASSRSARSRSPSASSASTSSHVSAPVTHGLVSTQRMPSPGTTKSSQRLVEQRVRRLTADGAAEDRVVPVHRELGLVQEQVAVLAQRVAEPPAGQLPLGLRVVEQLGEGDARAQGLVDAGGAGEQGVVVDRAGRRRATPGTRRSRRRAAAARPRSRGRDARRASSVVRTPRRGAPASGARPRPRGRRTCWSRRWRPRPRRRRSSSARSRLRAGWPAPLVGALRGLDLAADQQRHGGLDVVPHVGVLARPSRARPRRAPASPRSTRPSAATSAAVRTRRDAGMSALHRRGPRAWQVEHQALADQRVERPLGQLEWPCGFFMMSHTSSWW